MGKNCAACIAVFVIVLISLSIAAQAKVIYVSTSGELGNDGSSWEQAIPDVRNAVELAETGDEIWVAAGDYEVYRTVINKDVQLYGGFKGNETSRDQRDPMVNKTTLIPSHTHIDEMIVFAPGTTSSAVLDGFTLSGGYQCACMIYCSTSSATISNNVIAGGYRFGILIGRGAPTIRGNIIRDNNCGIRSTGSSAVIEDNVIEHNFTDRPFDMSSGIYVTDGSPTIARNVVTRNISPFSKAGAIYCSGDGVISNNLVANNMGAGIVTQGGFVSVIGNVVKGNAGAGISAGGKVINNVVCGNYTGIECQPFALILNNTITSNAYLGLYFSDYVAVYNNIIAFNGHGISSGFSEVNPQLRNNCIYGNSQADYLYIKNYTGIGGNISIDPLLASTAFGDVHIQPGSPCIDAGDSTQVEKKVLDMDGQARVIGLGVDIGADESDGTEWSFTPKIIRVSPDGDDSYDGSSWMNAKQSIQAAIDAASPSGAEIWVKSGTYRECVKLPAYIYLYGGFDGSENYLQERNWAKNTTVIDADSQGSVVTCLAGHRVNRIDGFTITDGLAPLILQEQFTAGYYGGGIFSLFSDPIIANNIIANNSAEPEPGSDYRQYGAGVFCGSTSPIIVGNLIVGNRTGASGIGGGIYCGAVSYLKLYTGIGPIILNNTIVDNHADRGGGIMLYGANGVRSVNNIIAFNSSGIISTNFNSNFAYNCLFGNVDYDTYGFDPIGTDGNISLDPLFRDPENGDYRLGWNSPCIDAGLADAPGLSLDLACAPRVRLNAVDIGAYEYQPTLVQIDLKPDEYPNCINLKSRGYISVAILSDADFDATSVAASTVKCAGATPVPTGKKLYQLLDVDSDGDLDMLLKFQTQSLILSLDAKEVIVTGRTTTGEYFECSDSVKLILPKQEPGMQGISGPINTGKITLTPPAVNK